MIIDHDGAWTHKITLDIWARYGGDVSETQYKCAQPSGRAAWHTPKGGLVGVAQREVNTCRTRNQSSNDSNGQHEASVPVEEGAL